MKALTVYLFDTQDQIRCVTFSKGQCKDVGWDFDKLESDSEAAELIRNYLLGVVADINWSSRINDLPITTKYSIPDKYKDYER